MQTITLPDFIQKWTASQRNERASSQEHFIDLCRLLGQPTPNEADPTGEYYAFEKGVTKTTGGQGFADVWKKGHFGWEYKGRHSNLNAAYQQLLRYREDLENPPLLVVCDLDEFQIHTNFTGTAKRVFSFTLSDLASPTSITTSGLPLLDVLHAVFTDPQRLRPEQTTEHVTKEAAAQFATLADSLRQRGEDPERAAHFLVRLLFCLFAEDIGLLTKGLFTTLVDRTRRNPSQFTNLVRQLFSAMSTGGWLGIEPVAYFNGGLFADDDALDLTADDLTVLSKASLLDWASVEPAIFGTLFERSLDPSKRAQLGAHFTSREHILMVVEPVLMAPLRRKWKEVQEQAKELIARRDASRGRARDNRQQELTRLLMSFASEIAAIRVLDPACGSGNFLYVALKLLLDLEKEVITFAASNGLTAFIPQVGPEQLFGIEVNPYAHELAQVVVWIGYIQWLRDNGFGIPSTPILKPLHNIQRMDAILTFDEEGRPIEPQWPEADVIIGNPPFLGDRRMRRELGDQYVDEVRKLYAGRLPFGVDLVCYWFEKSRQMIEAGRLKRAGLLATQGIRGGANRAVLSRIKQTGDIFWAESDQDWMLEGAAVNVSMVGFDGGLETQRVLDGIEVAGINADLTASTDLTMARPLAENKRLSFIGTQKSGPFDLTHEQAKSILSEPPNINGRYNSDVVRPWINATDITQKNRNMWVIDFGPRMTLEEAAQYEKPFEYVVRHVKPIRDVVRRDSHRAKWWLFGDTRPGLRAAISGLCRYIATPMVSKHRLFVWVPVQVIPENLVVAIARDDDYFFGLLHSGPHELWALRMGTALEDRPRYTPTSTFETFPFPWPPGSEPSDDPRVQAISTAARELVEKRDQWLNPPGASESELKKRTLTNLYNQRPTWLEMAHRKLDEAVLEAYGWPPTLLSDEEILEKLLALNLERQSA